MLMILALAVIGGCKSNGRAIPGVKTLALTGKKGYLEYVLRQREEDRESKPGGESDKFKETIIEQRLFVETDGYVYHPNLLDFSIGALFGLTQSDFRQSVDGRSTDSSQDGNILEFDISGMLLKKKSYPLTFSARRARSLTPRPFRSSIDTTTTRLSAQWQYVSARTPIMLRLTHSIIEQDPFVQAGEEPGREENTILRIEADHIFNEWNVLSLVYDHEALEQRPFPTDYVIDELWLTHRLDFGDSKQHRLKSELNYRTQKGSFDSEQTSWTELLRFKHTDRLNTWFRSEWYDRSQGGLATDEAIGEQSVRVEGGLTHRLYESLESNLEAHYQLQEFDTDLTIERFGGSASFGYKKKNRWGLLLIDYSVSFEQIDQSSGEATFEVIERPYVFLDSAPIVLEDANIISGSIIILREDRTQVYQRESDYRIHRVGDLMELERITTGRITNEETVLISYRYEVFGDYQFDNVTQRVGVRQNFSSGLSPYYRLIHQRQTLAAKGEAGITPNDIIAYVVGLEYKSRQLRLLAEYEDHDSTIRPFRAIRLNGDYTRGFKSGMSVSVGAGWSEIHQSPPERRDTTILSLRARFQYPITRRLKIEGGVAYRDETDTLYGKDEGLEAEFSLDYSIRQTALRLTYEFSALEDDFAKQDSSTLYLQIRRSF